MIPNIVKDILAKIGESVKRHRQEFWLALCVALVGWTAYNLGLIRTQQPTGISAARMSVTSGTRLSPSASAPVVHRDLRVVTSKSSSSKKYHFTWCASAARIKPENRVWFATEAAARTAGYTLAGNCTR